MTEAASALGKRLLKNGETLTDEEEDAPQMDGLTSILESWQAVSLSGA